MTILESIMTAILEQRPAQAVSGASVSPRSPGSMAVPSAQPALMDIEAVLNEKNAEKNADLKWRYSVVDFLKLVDVDSSLDARKELAKELGYTGVLNGSAEMNIWLHKQVMRMLAESGCSVPANLYE
jgi:hypothetical protein